MKHLLVSGLLNTETSVPVRKFPVDYYPIDYPFFGIKTVVSGVAWNVAKALKTLGNEVRLLSMTGRDLPADLIQKELQLAGISPEHVKPSLQETPASAVLFDENGQRQIYCDLKDIQEAAYDFPDGVCDDCGIVIACNTNFNRPLLSLAKQAEKLIATDVHVLSNPHDSYNRDFMAAADILFLSDEALWADPWHCLEELARIYGNQIIVQGRGSKGALMYLREENSFYELPAVTVGKVINTAGAGDALFSAFIHYLVKDFHPVEALIRAELFASAKIGSSGASNGFIGEDAVDSLYTKFAEQLKENL